MDEFGKRFEREEYCAAESLLSGHAMREAVSHGLA
jgi:hypothetical protein